MIKVIYFVDPLDELVIEKLPKYKKKNLQNASKDDLHIGGKDEKKVVKELGKMYKELTKWWKELLRGQNVETVKVSIIPTDSCVLPLLVLLLVLGVEGVFKRTARYHYSFLGE